MTKRVKLTVEQVEGIVSDARRILDRLEAHVKQPYWFLPKEGFDSTTRCIDYTYCIDCIKSIMPDDAEYGDDYDGGFDSEQDGSLLCDKCREMLEYTLTDYGTEQELWHFRESGFDWSNAVACYELNRVAWGVYGAKQTRVLAHVLLRSKNQPEEFRVALKKRDYALEKQS